MGVIEVKTENKTEIKSKEISTIDELLEFIKEIYVWQEENNNKTNDNKIDDIHKTRLWFRGVENADWELLPSVQRNNKRIEKERFITNDFYIKANQVMERAPDKKNYSSWMSIMQHYGLPTRLLDWSSSPLIATFFATENYKAKTDACVWVLVPRLLNKSQGFEECIYPVDSETAQNMLLPAFKKENNIERLNDKILACHSTENDLRMYSQQANFTIHNSLKKITDMPQQDMLYKIIIPCEIKEKLLKDLEILGITESFIYPDLDHISKDIKRIYGLD